MSISSQPRGPCQRSSSHVVTAMSRSLNSVPAGTLDSIRGGLGIPIVVSECQSTTGRPDVARSRNQERGGNPNNTRRVPQPRTAISRVPVRTMALRCRGMLSTRIRHHLSPLCCGKRNRRQNSQRSGLCGGGLSCFGRRAGATEANCDMQLWMRAASEAGTVHVT